ncbi:acyl-CoA dehydrogenase family protein [Mesorhizobium sp. B2-7-1]|uniref:acyl-CoA dehydrogenase family protein n=1 Tax=Mesorhizobium sp. B2-7-1 TaxID=2589909 RepID=UPI0011269930|nr:acyl-CoA dehydrogenase family protein [Mesorhizobium sp. B2-7-1]TPJ54198.1 acyl-CoA dehydrogenase [Mesorhizobium sp. B2-7-1]
MTYNPPIPQILLAMHTADRFAATQRGDLSPEDVQAILFEAGRFASERIAPLNPVGDRTPSALDKSGKVTTPPGWRETYQAWREAGWNSLTGPTEYGGQGLPISLAAACTEFWNSSSMAFALCPLLTAGAIEAISEHASQELKDRYLPKLVSGEWTGTMNLTEPQAGSDLSNLRCKAKRTGDGSYRITGNKIFITYGEHDCSPNIIHLVLARLEDAPAGTRGISLFLVPKILPDGSHNDLRCLSLEHKLGIHGSPTCAMAYGDNGGARGWLIGEENRGLNCMFTMMNNARLLVGAQGVALAERATQAAFAYARERLQGRAPGRDGNTSPIILHPDVRRMLLEMRTRTAAARMLCMATASSLDSSVNAQTEKERHRAYARASLLTPLAKAYSTDIAVEVTSTAIQVHGGMGYVEDTGVAQYYRDARILPIYEGTNGIQAIDLVTRKLLLGGGETLSQIMESCRRTLSGFDTCLPAMQAVADTVDLAKMLGDAPGGSLSLAVAVPFQRALANVVAGAHLAEAAALARGGALETEAAVNAKFFIAVELVSAVAAAKASLSGADATGSDDLE